ncbi:flagellar biosynthetic protein FliR [Desulfovibrio litoralis]|uniref:Flagellar biosynthetic protein FliR n=1 Tax=Desulfovibrio litoralis DSM 11393 TaxID=1121455 RepID=A0A1M7TCT6_9BACT|nr:flagellar biosynthetic protein FliR [Desulfovibrio litoralis]SHN68523.1 flagellar biosynthetic protein FliR [Desulfovibrio litoralis DSM 11393]
MNVFNFNYVELLGFLLTFVRVSIVIFLLPIFGGDSVPMRIKAYLAAIITFVLFPSIALDGNAFPLNIWSLTIFILGEIFVGLTLSLMVQFVFAGIQTGGQVLGFQMGFTMVTAIDPLTGGQTAITSHFLYMIAVLIFFIFNGHLVMLYGISQSFTLIPPGSLLIRPELLDFILELSGNMFILALHIGAPVIVALFTVELALALMGRAAPQMNLLMIGFPVKIAVGFFFMGVLFTIISDHIQNFVEILPNNFAAVIHSMSPF